MELSFFCCCFSAPSILIIFVVSFINNEICFQSLCAAGIVNVGELANPLKACTWYHCFWLNWNALWFFVPPPPSSIVEFTIRCNWYEHHYWLHITISGTNRYEKRPTFLPGIDSFLCAPHYLCVFIDSMWFRFGYAWKRELIIGIDELTRMGREFN